MWIGRYYTDHHDHHRAYHHDTCANIIAGAGLDHDHHYDAAIKSISCRCGSTDRSGRFPRRFVDAVRNLTASAPSSSIERADAGGVLAIPS